MNWTALAPVPMTRDPLAAEIDVVVPPRRVERRAGERVEARDVGEARPVELADRADRPRWPRASRRCRRGRAPPRSSAGRRRTLGATHLGAEADVLAELEVVGARAGSSRAARPAVEKWYGQSCALRERVAVVVVRVVDATARDSVFSDHVPPTSSFFSTITNVDAGLLQSMRGEQPRHARPR